MQSQYFQKLGFCSIRRWKFVNQFWTTEKGTKVSLEAGGISLADTPKLEA